MFDFKRRSNDRTIFLIAFAMSELGFGEPGQVRAFKKWISTFKRPVGLLDDGLPDEKPDPDHSYDGQDWFFRWDFYPDSGIVVGRPDVHSKSDFDLPRDKRFGYIISGAELEDHPPVNLADADERYLYINYPDADAEGRTLADV